jgi:hypothetical protein
MTAGQRQLALFLLLGANLLPIFGAVFLGWDATHALLIYWSENLVVGFYALLRMAAAPGPWPLKMFMMPFFTFHFGIFTIVHGVFVLLLTRGFEVMEGAGPDPWGPLGLALEVAPWAVLALFVSHGYSFFANYYLGGERAGTTVMKEMSRPYSRVMVMHFSILASFFLVMAAQPLFASPYLARVVPLFVLVAIKLAVDAKFHLNSHGIRISDLTVN